MARGHVSALDIEIGRKIRLRRLEQSMSQTALAEKLNVTFQQVLQYPFFSSVIDFLPRIHIPIQ